ncbi:MAG: TolC family protein [Nitrospirales bacterium]|nr:TolC family protein [Nitrospira sp.]MDR4502509.1 TolC family protein [Nitrospirales bacterium]
MHVMTIFLMFIVMSGFTPARTEAKDHAVAHKKRALELQDILSIALAHNPLLVERQSLVEQKEGHALAASAYPNPTLDIQSGRGSLRDPSMGSPIMERYVTLSQPLEWPGTRHAEQRAARASVQSAEAGLAQARLNVTAQVKQAFYTLLFFNRQHSLAMQNIQTVKRLYKAIQSKVKSGEAPPFDAIKMKVETLKLQKERIRTTGASRTAQATLNSLTAGKLGTDFSIRGTFKSLPDDWNSSHFSEDTLSSHPAIIMGQKRVEEAQERHQKELQARVPNVTLNGSYQRDIGREAFVGSLSIPLPLWHQRQGEIAQAKGVMRQEEATLLATRTQLRKDMSQHLQEIHMASAQISTYEHGLLAQAREALRIAQVSFQYGETSLLEVLDAQRVMRETELEYTHAKYDLSIALTNLERLIGHAGHE